ncbi:MAG: DUF4982 domain-containing protein [Bacteroidales bacterium]|nr:DUF4982 domain-containing protein [Bacteroidales bacterium]
MTRRFLLSIAGFFAFALMVAKPAPSWQVSSRQDILLEKGWVFSRDSSVWQPVRVPHDWAIYGPFSRDNDLQEVVVTQNYEKKASVKTGRTGGLPYVGCGWYRGDLTVPEGKHATLLFDGAMSDARVFLNGREICRWPYGYNSFHVDITPYLHEGPNALAVRLENLPNSSRWYPGAGLYRNVHLILTEEIHVPVWGTHLTTPEIAEDSASVRLETRIEGPDGVEVSVETGILDPSGKSVASSVVKYLLGSEQPVEQMFTIDAPKLWSPESPSLYRAVSRILRDGKETDVYETVFGIRTIQFDRDRGFLLNGVPRKFQGVCNHHDLGPLGAAVNESAIRHQLELLKDMGCDAIRTSHNMPAPELVRLCDEMGFMMMLEPFDEWDVAKCRNGYHRYFDEWAEKDMENMLHQYRNNPSVVMWSIGNEVPTQCSPGGYRVASFLRDICHREDPTRPVTCGMDQVSCVLENGFAAVIDIPGLNYRTFRYIEAHETLPQGLVLGSETGSTVSSRGVYKLPAVKRFSAVDEDHQCSAYELDACAWSNIPDIDFALAEDYPWTLGQFVWTGFDYLGEPSPYDKDAWPNHSSMFGIIDLASIPKDRYWLFRSVWNRNEPTLHLLPHWNWSPGDSVSVMAFTSYDEAELFVNGVSQGRRIKRKPSSPTLGGQEEALEDRYRLIWEDVPFEPGELKVVAYSEGVPVAEKVVRTAGKPHHIVLEASNPVLKPDGKDICYVTATVVDRMGNPCPLDSSLMTFKVRGAGSFRAAANGDPTCLDIFHEPRMHAFGGKLSILVQSADPDCRHGLTARSGRIVLTVRSRGLRRSRLVLRSSL